VKIDGTDHLAMEKIRQQTNKTEVQKTEGTSSDAEVRKRQESIRGKALTGEAAQDYTEELEETIKQANDAADAVNLDLRFQLHEETERIMVEVYDIKNDEVVKELPPEKLLNLVGQIQDLIGFFLDEQR